jgi:hypothetical protein
MEHLNLLILEDNDEDFSAIHSRNIESFNKLNTTVNFNYVDFRVSKVEDAEKLLSKDTIFHSAIIDLKLALESADEGKGNKLISLIINKYRIPIFVYSNNIALLNSEFNSQKGCFFKTYSKASKIFTEILTEISDINKTGIIDILGKRGHIEDVLDKVFWRHISNSLGSWIQIEQDKKNKEKMLLRHVSEYILQYLNINDDTGEFEKFNKLEFYTIPPIHEKVTTGDILMKNETEECFVVITPSCDLANKDTVKNIQIVSIIPPNKGPLHGFLKEIKKIEQQEKQIEKKDRYDSCTTNIFKILANTYALNYYYLPETNQIIGGLMDFQEISTIKKSLVNSVDYLRIASIASPFLKDIIVKFSYYYSRQGSPDFDNSELYREILI